MVCWGMPDLRVGITLPPSENGGTVDNQITSPDEPTPKSGLHRHDQQSFPNWGKSLAPTFPRLAKGKECAAGPRGLWATHKPVPKPANCATNRAYPGMRDATASEVRQ